MPNDANQHTMQDPITQYPQPGFPKQPQDAPGLSQAMTPKPDHGEDSYHGAGRLEGRKAVVTGGDSGIGRATAIAFAREGADVVIAYLPEEEPDATETIKQIEEAGRKAVRYVGDLSKEDNCKALIDVAVTEMGSIDILAIIAGKQVSVPSIDQLTTEQFEQTFATNVYGMFWLCKYAIPHMPKGGSIINTASIQAYQPSPSLLDYASTKAAIVAFTQALGQQLVDKGIRVNAVAPGPVWTPLQPSGGQPQDKVQKFGSEVPYGRPAQPAELAPSYVFFASQESSYTTCEVLGVTGGNHLP